MNFKLAYDLMNYLDEKEDLYKGAIYKGSMLSRISSENSITNIDFEFICRFYVRMYGLLRHYERISGVLPGESERGVYSKLMWLYADRNNMDGVIGLSELLRYKDDYLSVLEKSFKYSGWNDVLKVDPKKNELLKKSDNPMSGDRYLNIKHDGCGYFRYEDGNKSIFTCDTIDGRWWCYESLSSLVDDKAEIDCLNVDVLSR